MNHMHNYLVHLRPRENTATISQNHSVLACGRDGWITDLREHGFFVHQTRMLSRYRCLIDGKPPLPVACSNVEQHTWLGYYIRTVPGVDPVSRDEGSGQIEPMSEHTLELRISRF